MARLVSARAVIWRQDGQYVAQSYAIVPDDQVEAWATAWASLYDGQFWLQWGQTEVDPPFLMRVPPCPLSPYPDEPDLPEALHD